MWCDGLKIQTTYHIWIAFSENSSQTSHQSPFFPLNKLHTCVCVENVTGLLTVFVSLFCKHLLTYKKMSICLCMCNLFIWLYWLLFAFNVWHFLRFTQDKSGHVPTDSRFRIFFLFPILNFAFCRVLGKQLRFILAGGGGGGQTCKSTDSKANNKR